MKRLMKKIEWAIVDQDGNVIEKYKYKCNADWNLYKMQKEHFDKELKVVYLESE